MSECLAPASTAYFLAKTALPCLKPDIGLMNEQQDSCKTLLHSFRASKLTSPAALSPAAKTKAISIAEYFPEVSFF